MKDRFWTAISWCSEFYLLIYYPVCYGKFFGICNNQSNCVNDTCCDKIYLLLTSLPYFDCRCHKRPVSYSTPYHIAVLIVFWRRPEASRRSSLLYMWREKKRKLVEGAPKCIHIVWVEYLWCTVHLAVHWWNHDVFWWVINLPVPVFTKQHYTLNATGETTPSALFKDKNFLRGGACLIVPNW